MTRGAFAGGDLAAGRLAFGDQFQQPLVKGIEVQSQFFEGHAELPECDLPLCKGKAPPRQVRGSGALPDPRRPKTAARTLELQRQADQQRNIAVVVIAVVIVVIVVIAVPRPPIAPRLIPATRLGPVPLAVAASWLDEATGRAAQPNPNSMVLATVDESGQPSARVVLCKQIAPQPGYLSFYSNYRSRKGRELATNARAAIVMHWDALRRQLRVEGRVVQASSLESDAYFATRNW